jgi:phage-related protein
MEDYSGLYQVALGADSRVANESWSKAFGEMTLNTEQWKTDTEKYIGDSKKAFENFNEALKPMKDSLSGSAKSIKDITNESKKLKTTLTEKDGVIDSLGKELTAVSQVT